MENRLLVIVNQEWVYIDFRVIQMNIRAPEDLRIKT